MKARLGIAPIAWWNDDLPELSDDVSLEEGWFVVEAEQDPAKNPPLEMAKAGHAELQRVMAATGYTIEA